VPISAPSVAGTQYAIVLSATGGVDASWLWRADDSGPYVDPSYISTDGGTSWVAQARDFAFRTYVTVAAAPTPAASLLDAATAAPSTGSPLATLGFALLLIGSLGTLAVVSVHAAVSRR
jgi:hypothetical protein